MLDIHAHLYWESYDADRDDVVRRAFEAGIERMICVGTEPGDNPKAVAVAEKQENIFAAVGLHPHFFNGIGKDTDRAFQKEIQALRETARHPKVVAIGECGLDYFSRDLEQPVTEEMKAVQKEGFLAQMDIAREFGLPLIIHTRPSAGTMDAYEDILDLLKAENHTLKVVFHCYQGDTEITKKFLELSEVFFSFAGSITYPVKKACIGTKNDPKEVVRLIPIERIFVETDAPFLAPVPHRGERNEPAFVVATAEQLCAFKQCQMDEFEKTLDMQFEHCFLSRNML
jgi:TatD DNase family protein